MEISRKHEQMIYIGHRGRRKSMAKANACNLVDITVPQAAHDEARTWENPWFLWQFGG
ncbi:hypothetical protein GCM10018779_52410 [Streptomyces griseocarneus]|nr:hypothetical protein GCM10018779_52410 [Streptomyces griseocarneus]